MWRLALALCLPLSAHASLPCLGGEGRVFEPPFASFLDDFSRHFSIPARPGPPMKTSAVYGKNNREAVPDLYPWRSIGQVSQTNGSQELCTGALIGACYVLTNAHCVQQNEVDVPPEQIAFYTVNSGPHSSVDAFIDGGPFRVGANDFAVLKLHDNLGDSHGSLGLCDISGPELAGGKNYNLAGFHADVEQAKKLVNDPTTAIISFDPKFPNKIYIKADTFFGSSGAPIFAFNNCVVAVNSFTAYHPDGTQATLPENTTDPARLGAAIAAHEFYARAIKFMDEHPCN